MIRSTMPRIAVAHVLVPLVLVMLAAAPARAGNLVRKYGGLSRDEGAATSRMPDGGYVIAGLTKSTSNGLGDLWLVRIKPAGAMVWQFAYGLLDAESAASLDVYPNGDILVAGRSSANNGDGLVMKVSSSGTFTWAKRFGGTGQDSFSGVRVTPDGGCILSGTYDNVIGGQDMWALKLDAAGLYQWDVVHGTTGGDTGSAVELLPAGGYLLAGTVGTAPAVITIDAAGTVIGNVMFTYTPFVAQALAIEPLCDGGYVLGGMALGATEDGWVARVDAAGNVTWQARLSETLGTKDRVTSIAALQDGGFALAGVEEPDRFFSMKLDAAGAITWQQHWSEVPGPMAPHVFEEADQTLFVTGTIQNDVALVHADEAGQVAGCSVLSAAAFTPVATLAAGTAGAGALHLITPVAANVTLGRVAVSPFTETSLCVAGAGAVPAWAGTYALGWDGLHAGVVQEGEGTIIAAGTTRDPVSALSAPWILRLDADGAILRQVEYINDTLTLSSSLRAVEKTADGGFITAGLLGSAPNTDAFVMKLRQDLSVQWATRIGDGLGDRLLAVEELEGGDFVACGYVDDSVQLDAFIVRLDAAGNVLWQGQYPGRGYNYVLDLEASRGGDLLLVGFDQGPWLLRVDGVTGAPISGQRLRNQLAIATTTGVGSRIVRSSDCTYLVDGVFHSSHALDANAWLLRIDESHGIQVKAGWKDEDLVSLLQTRSILDLPGGGALVGGYVYDVVTNYPSTWTMKLDPSWNVTWARSWAATNEWHSYPEEIRIDVASEGGYLVGDTQGLGTGGSPPYHYRVNRVTDAGDLPASCNMTRRRDIGPRLFKPIWDDDPTTWFDPAMPTDALDVVPLETPGTPDRCP